MLKGLRRYDVKTEAQNAYNVIKSGGLVMIESKVGYGLLGHSAESMKRKYKLKNRSFEKRCICIGNQDIFNELSVCTKEEKIIVEELSKRYLICFVTPYNPDSKLLTELDEFTLQQVTKDGTIGIFLNLGTLAETMAGIGLKENILLTGSSANVSLTGNNYTVESVEPEIRESVDYIVDGGMAVYHNPNGLPGTVLDLKTLDPIRKGALYSEIMGSLEYLKSGH
ncbi:MAG: Sua5/YciO/YrdC/YwlC family protein [Desulfobacteraceae bacterium]|nr:Sua5/YciO/YrdC/YwlC family protein [Desulfobacteraceae bacterium]